mmetsp:Transcript_18173/g.25670  ORF Transcript_18173/g.25670 Transcript_18173/m.25670 type:complete len:514 (+) Transcript_18173:2303-3844(+)
MAPYHPKPDVDPNILNILHEFHIPSAARAAKPISTSFTVEYYCSGWKNMKEKTSSGLSSMHFGHHKACAFHTHNASCETMMLGLPYQYSFSPARYQFSINTMLLKKARKLDASSLCTILLLEADFIFMNKKLGGDCVNHAERLGLLAPEQFGSTAHHSSINQVIVKRLYYDTLQTLKQPGFLCSNDATGCYDWILHLIASLATQRIGLPFEPMKCMLTTLQNMIHFIQTSHGLSHDTYGRSRIDGKPVQGMGQGNRASPCIWALISTPLLNNMCHKQFGAQFKTPLSSENIYFVSCMFVDDSDLLQTSQSSSLSIEELSIQMQQAIDEWEFGFRITGGALALSKSWIYPIAFNWSNSGEASYASVEDLNLSFQMKDKTQQVSPLSQCGANEGMETLGVFLAPDGNSLAQVQHMCKKVQQWTDKIRTNPLNRQSTLLALKATIMRSLLYPISSLNLTKQECRKIMWPLYKYGLQQAGICSNLPTILCSQTSRGIGQQIPCLYTMQGLTKLEKYL